MKGLRSIISSILLLLASPVLMAQWSGSLNLSGGYGWLPLPDEVDRATAAEVGLQDLLPPDYLVHALAQAGLNLRYTTPKWTWKTTLDGRWEPKGTDNQRGSIKDKFEFVEKTVRTRPLSVNLRSDVSWKPARDRSYDAWIRYQYRHDAGVNETGRLSVLDDPEAKLDMSYYYEEPSMNEHLFALGGGTRHELGSPRRVLQSVFSFEGKLNSQFNQWVVLKTGAKPAAGNPPDELGLASSVYRITPRNEDFNISARVHYRDSLIRGPVNFVLDPGLRLASQHENDLNSGANLDLDEYARSGQMVWRDSVRLREHFDYLTLRIEPYVAGDLSWKRLRLQFDYGLQLYGRRLNNEEHRQPMQLRQAYPVGNSTMTWQINARHRLFLENTLSVSHPDYFKICWYERTGGYLNQLYRGNEKLLSTSTDKYALGYEFKPKRFRSRTTVAMTRKTNEVEQTWSNQEIEGRLYKVFTWLNAADSWTFGATERLDWEGKLLTARLELTYNQTLRTIRETGATKRTFDWNLTSGVTARPGAGWELSADVRYQSKVQTFFSLFDQYCVFNARVQKKFRKITVYLEGRDLLDGIRTTTFESVDHKEMWEEKVRANRRLIILGLNWSF